jgi:perosamine synthetase
MSSEVPLARPWFGPEEADAVNEVLASGWVSQGPRVEAFEQNLAKLLGCRSVIAVNSGTSALMLALRSLDIGPGDSVIVPAFGCAATVLPVLESGAKAIFADVDPTTFNLTWESISSVLEPSTKAVILVHMFGRIAEVEKIVEECNRRNLLLVEDAALALGARKESRFAGAFGAAGCFSFHPRKIVTTGEGGAICTDSLELAGHAREARNYGAAQTAWTRFQTGDGRPRGFNRLGFNCKLTDLQAAIGLVQLNRLPQFLSRRAEIATRYTAGLARSRLILPCLPAAPLEHVFQAYVCVWSPEPLTEITRDPHQLAAAESSLCALKKTMAQAQIAVSDAAQFLPELPVFGLGHLQRACPNSHALSRLAFAIPIYPLMTDEQIDRVIAALLKATEQG